MVHMTWQAAFEYADRRARLTCRRYRVYKSRARTGHWFAFVQPDGW